jgi:hypothetical protein
MSNFPSYEIVMPPPPHSAGRPVNVFIRHRELLCRHLQTLSTVLQTTGGMMPAIEGNTPECPLSR